jgi:hypothetical protein
MKQLLALLALFVVSVTAFAQDFPRKAAAIPRFALLVNPSVKRELAITTVQEKMLEEIMEPLRVGQGLRLAADTDIDAFDKKINKVLTDAQLERLQQIWLQRVGTLAILTESVAKQLNVTADQNRQLDRIFFEMTEEIKNGLVPTDGTTARSAGMAARESARKKISAILTNEQQEKWQSMLGKKFDLQQKN